MGNIFSFFMSSKSFKDTNDLGSLARASQWQLIKRKFSRHKLAVFALNMLIILYLLAAFCEFFAPYNPNAKKIPYMYSPPHAVKFNFVNGFYTTDLHQEVDQSTLKKVYVENVNRKIPLKFFVKGDSYTLWGLFHSNRHFFGVDTAQYYIMYPEARAESIVPAFLLLGGDAYGRDLLSRIIYGCRISLSVGLLGIAITFFLGLTIGGISGYLGGRVDIIAQRFIELLSGFPGLPLFMALAAAMPDDWSPLLTYFCIVSIMSILGWTGLARVVRSKMFALREEEYSVAARLLGASHSRIIFRHLLPGFTSHIVVSLTMSIPGMILGETGLSFLGLGLRPPVVSLGVLLQDCMNIQAVAHYPWLLLPALFVTLIVLSFNFLGDGLRDAADPYAHR
jgi:peptide/nickel transport system permease protein